MVKAKEEKLVKMRRVGSKRARDKLSEYTQEMAVRDEEYHSTRKKRRGQRKKLGKNTREDVESDKEEKAMEDGASKPSKRARVKLCENLPKMAAWDEEDHHTSKKTSGGQGKKNTRENVASVSKSHRRERSKDAVVENGGDSAKEKEKEIVQDNASQTRNRKRIDENGNEIGSNMCHQCQRKDKGRVVRCTNCKTKRYCVPCMTTWYPGMLEEDFETSCPVCRLNCNCKACLQLDGAIRALMNLKFEIGKEEKVQYSIFIVQKLLPFLRRFNAEQVMEMESEAKIQGVPVSELKLQKATCWRNERMYCNNCKISIFDFHRNCSSCSYKLCLTCCRELRDGHCGKCQVCVWNGTWG